MNRIIDVSKARIPSVKIPIDNGGGNATVGQVLAGSTFDSESGLLQVGTMVNKSGIWEPATGMFQNGAGVLTFFPTTAYYTPSSGLSEYDANFIAANIPLNMSMFGLAGTGANVKRWATGTVTSNGTTSFFDITGLAFNPKLVMWWQSGSTVLFSEGIAWNTGQSFSGSTAYNNAQAYNNSGASTGFNNTAVFGTGQVTHLSVGVNAALSLIWYAFE